ncbi:MAG: FlgD immunoglobulin-like domain containing protein [candidate division WOR-3 bacterium]
MPRRIVVASCLLLLGVSFGSAELHRLGLIREDLAQIAPEREVKVVVPASGQCSFRDRPRVDLSDEMPPVGNQGAQGSCAAWAIAYYHRTQLEYRERRWNLADPRHQFSPAFTYNQVNGGADRGSGFGDNMPLICDQGCASLFDFPYDQYNCTRWPSESAYARALPFRTKDWSWAYVYDTFGINHIKQLLVNGSTATLGIDVWGNFDEIRRFNNTYCVADKMGSNRGGHLVTFVGYDDSMVTNDGLGAFKMVNSWGTGWGAQGYFWMSYQAVMDPDLSHQAFAWLVDTVGYEPKLLARIQIEHPTRDRVGIQFTVGRRFNALWIKDFRQWRRAEVEQPFPANKLVFDLTEAADFITGRRTDSVYFCTNDSRRDNRTGTVLYSSVQHLDWGTEFVSSATPVPIPDDGSTVDVGMRIVELEHDVSCTRVFEPLGRVEPESSYVPRVEVRNFGSEPAAFGVLLLIDSAYRDSARVTGLVRGRAETLSFAPWVAAPRCTVAVSCSTRLTEDQYPDNDRCVVEAFSRYTDAAVIGIAPPGDTVDSGVVVRPQVRVRNNGTQTESFFVTLTIPSDGYQRTARATVPADSEMFVLFAPWTPVNLGSHLIRCTLELAGDMDQSNNSLGRVVFVRPGAGLNETGTMAEPGLIGLSPTVFAERFVAVLFLPRAMPARMTIFDASGARVRQLTGASSTGGYCEFVWDRRDAHGVTLPAGAYLCRLESGRSVWTTKLVAQKHGGR